MSRLRSLCGVDLDFRPLFTLLFSKLMRCLLFLVYRIVKSKARRVGRRDALVES
jgi:hypothetical protein